MIFEVFCLISSSVLLFKICQILLIFTLLITLNERLSALLPVQILLKNSILIFVNAILIISAVTINEFIFRIAQAKSS